MNTHYTVAQTYVTDVLIKKTKKHWRPVSLIVGGFWQKGGHLVGGAC